ncbi:histidine-type phosphatase [uncultured Bacteroides sp.]|uniref:histidine-type phosphatase n=1 Tax=uncultured Bacteroides sp. TaxID=162156 RepID=UPI002630A9CD|nr:histidine-type phosphatase [uncultured Bacteroides sp.]
MKKSFLLGLLCCSYFVLNAQTAKEEINDNIYLSAANYYAYPNPTSKLTPAPSGYKPFYLSHYGRHGSRYLIDPNDYKYPLHVLQEAKHNDVLTGLGENTLTILDSISAMAEGRYGELTALGARQHKEIAARMYRNFPEIFQGDATIDARSTVVIRCILSMMAECNQLQALNPKLHIAADASHHDMYYMNNNDPYFVNIREGNRIDSLFADLKKKYAHPERLMKSLFKDTDYIKWKIDGTELMIRLYSVAVNMQSHDTDMELFSLFTKDELYDLWRITNVYWYAAFGPAPLTEGKMPYIQANLLENFLDTADTCIVKKDNTATLRFGHESCLLPLVCLLELDNADYQTTDLDNLDKEWRNYKFFPMASNVQFIFYRKKKSDDILLKVLLNETEATLPVETDMAPYYHWKDVESYYRNKLASFRKN